ncbi:glycosyl hydrolase family 28-related protein [Taibaiella koreensis]|uniref:glycosyl hydrolase family 28-related protein n=1 Tax=Taibaiella koreensis TaxID=1268548 RepID=UPI000E59C490|nr:glycosyl hydrolase family 28-related protein [Taibaiella koreensis]
MPITFSPFNVVDVTHPDYGAVGNGIADDTEAIKKAVTALAAYYTQIAGSNVAAASAPTLLFPRGMYLIKETIEFSLAGSGPAPEQLKIIGENAIISPYTTFNGAAGFQFNHALDIGLTKLNFTGFPGTALHMFNPNLNSARVTIESCEFHDNVKGIYIETGSTLCTIEKCKFFNNNMAIDMNGGDQLTIRDCWLETNSMGVPDQANPTAPIYWPAQIENRMNAYVLVESTIFVKAAAVLGNVVEPAWINNHDGSITCHQIRAGSEYRGLTLINNFAKARPIIGSSTAIFYPNAIIVKDSQCYATEDNDWPAIVRYVEAIPNQTVIRNNRGMINAAVMNFSKSRYNQFLADNTGSTLSFNDYARQYIVNNSMVNGDPSGLIASDILVEVANNVRGNPQDNGSQVPTPLLDFVRDAESRWPTSFKALPVLHTHILADTNGTQYGIEYTFEYPADIADAMLLIRYSGNPLPSGWSGYSGGYSGLLKANGALYGNLTGWFWELRELFNKIGSAHATFATVNSSFNVAVRWNQGITIPATPDSFSVLQSPTPPAVLTPEQRQFTISFTGSRGNDHIEVIPMSSLAL